MLNFYKTCVPADEFEIISLILQVMRTLYLLSVLLAGVSACSPRSSAGTGEISRDQGDSISKEPPAGAAFNADSAYAYVARQVEFGPRVPNTEAHRRAGDWLVAELRRHGAEVTEQKADLRAFDGTLLKAHNIFGRINPDVPERILLMAHYDCRPWADEDPDHDNRHTPVDGANDGASGVGVILEAARQLKEAGSKVGIDFLFVDAEDWGTEGDDESWALGARHFAMNPPIPGYRPDKVILLDMVGGRDAVFPREMFSQHNAPELLDEFYRAAAVAGVADRFPDLPGGAITDDHLEFLKLGVPAIDIIEFDNHRGFNPTWHTLSDNMDNISAETLGAVGKALMAFLSGYQ